MSKILEDKKLEIFTERLKNDKKFYIENFLKIRNKKSKLVPFKINAAQQQFLDLIDENTRENKPHRYIILKARQMGISTVCEGYIFRDTATREYVNSLIIAHEDKATQTLFNMSKLFYDELPAALKPMKKYSNEKALVFENPTNNDDDKVASPGLRSKITVATAGTSETGRSGNFNNLHISELAFFPDAQRTLTALLQCVPDELETFVALESTANGVGGAFYDLWQLATKGESEFTPIFLPWFTDPLYTKPFRSDEEMNKFLETVNHSYTSASGEQIYTEEFLLQKQFSLTLEQLNWRKFTIGTKCLGDIDIFKQEYPSTAEEAFIASGRPRFNLKTVKQYELSAELPKFTGLLARKGKSSKVDLVENEKGFVQIYKYPVANESYVIGADVAEGLITGDYSTGVVLNENCDVVCLWKGHMDPDLFGKELVALGYFYNEAYIGCEANNHGLTTLKAIVHEDYYNIYYSKIYDRMNDILTKKLGWATNQRTKPLMINKLAEFVREFLVGIPAIEIIKEMYTYVIDEKGRTNAQRGEHDDCIIALAIAIQVYLEGRGEDYMPEKTDISLEKKKENFDIPNIIDPLFEGESTVEVVE